MSVEPPAGSYVPASRYGTLQRLAALAGWFPAAVVTVAALGLGAAVVQPGLGFWDTGEFQAVGPVLGTAHPTGFPAYVILGWLASIVLQPLGEPALRMNLLSVILIATAAAALAVLVRHLVGRPWLGAAAGLLLATSPIGWRIASRADPHAFHIALVALLLVTLVGWEDRRRRDDRNADRWLLAAAAVYGVALANHSLALLLAPGIGLFVLAVEPRLVLRPGFIVRCAALLVLIAAGLYLELPIRAAMHAPLVYGRPDTLDGFRYVVLAEQFRGSLIAPFGDLAGKAGTILATLSDQLGDLLPLAGLGFLATLWRRPRYALLSGVSFVITVWFAASYVNADIDRYYLGPLLFALSWLVVGVALVLDLLETALGWTPLGAGSGARWPAGGWPGPASLRRWPLELAAAAMLLGPLAAVAPGRLAALQTGAPTAAQRWVDRTLAHLPQGAVVVSWWSYSTPLWYAQRVAGRRPDIWIVDDRTRLDQGLGGLSDVIDAQLGRRPVYLIRPPGEIVTLQRSYRLEAYTPVPGLDPVVRVVARLGAGQ